MIRGNTIVRTRNQFDPDNGVGNNQSLQHDNDRIGRFESSTTHVVAEQNQGREVDISDTSLKSRRGSWNQVLLVTMKRMFEEQWNDLTSHMVKHLSDVVRPMLINSLNDVMSKPGSSNFPPFSSAQYVFGTEGQVIPCPPSVRILQRPEIIGSTQNNVNEVEPINGNNLVNPIQTNLNENNNGNAVNQNARQHTPLSNMENAQPVGPVPYMITHGLLG